MVLSKWQRTELPQKDTRISIFTSIETRKRFEGFVKNVAAGISRINRQFN